jgi:hypothetical protein
VRQGWFREKSFALFHELYESEDENFRFSNGWFRAFLQRYRISLRFSTNTSQKTPEEYQKLIICWLRFNRRNSQIRPFIDDVRITPNLPFPPVGRFLQSNIFNIDEIPLCFEYLDGRTYAPKGSKTVRIRETRSGWDKRQATLLLCIFADGIPRIPPLILFAGTGRRLGTEPQFYDQRVVVNWTESSWNNEDTYVFMVDKYISHSRARQQAQPVCFGPGRVPQDPRGP